MAGRSMDAPRGPAISVPSIRFSVPGDPRAKGRPRLGRTGVYTDRATVAYESIVCLCAMQARGDAAPIEGPIGIEITAYFRRPKRLGRRTTAADAPIPHAARPDLDNIVKAILDGTNRSGIWRDDAQISAIWARKVYCRPGDLPVVEVGIYPIE